MQRRIVLDQGADGGGNYFTIVGLLLGVSLITS